MIRRFRMLSVWMAAGACLCLSLHAQKQQTQKPCIAVMDFVNPDISGQKKFLNFESKKIHLGNGCTLNDQDRVSMNSVMQGYVRMIDAQDISRTNSVNRQMLLTDNEFNRAKTIGLYHSVVRGQARPLLMGADYLTASLSKHPEVFSCMDSRIILHAMDQLSRTKDFPASFMLRLAQETGATHLIYGTIADIHSKTRSFKGYGIQTKTILYELDVIVKVADLPAQKILYSKVYTGIMQEKDMGTGGLEIDNNKYQTLMKSAMEQAGEDLYEKFNPAKAGSFKVTPIPSRSSSRASQPLNKQTGTVIPAGKNGKSNAGTPAPRQNETVILQQTLPAPGRGIVPPPPVPVPVAGNNVVIAAPAVPVIQINTANQ